MDKTTLQKLLSEAKAEQQAARKGGDDVRIFHADRNAEWITSRIDIIEQREVNAAAREAEEAKLSPRELAARLPRYGG